MQSLLGIAILYERCHDEVYGWTESFTPIGVTAHGKPLTLLSNSTSRSIWTDGRIVVKVDRGTPQADEEASVWLALEPEDRQYFAPLLEVGDGYVVQEYVKLQKGDDDNWPDHGDATQYFEQAQALFDKYDMGWDWQGWAQFGVDERTGMLCIHDYSCYRKSGEHRFSTLNPELVA